MKLTTFFILSFVSLTLFLVMNAGADDTNTEQQNHETGSSDNKGSNQDHPVKRGRGEGGNNNKKRNGRSADADNTDAAEQSTTETQHHHSHEQRKLKNEQRPNKSKIQESRRKDGRARPTTVPHTDEHKKE